VRTGLASSALLAASAIALAAAPARADSRNIIVLESYDRRQPKDAERLLAPLLDELGGLGYIVGADLASRISAAMSLPGETGERNVAAAIRAVDAGWSSWLNGDFKAAIDTLTGAVDILHENPATFASAPEHRELMMRALVGVALGLQRLEHGDRAQTAMAELIRSFPDQELDRAEFGPEAYALYRRVAAELREQRPGSLRVAVDDDGAAVFINERFAGTGEVVQTRLAPGRYRVYVRRGRTGGRLHIVDVAAGVDRVVSIDTALDAALRSAPHFIGLRFNGADERARLESGKATAIAREVGASGVIVVSIRQFEGRRSIVGSLLSLDSGKPQRSAAIAVEPTLPTESVVRSLARFLAGEDPAPGLIVAAPRPDLVATGPRESRFGAWPWIAAGVGVAAIAAGAVLFDLDGPIFDDQDRHTPDEYRTRNAGIGLTVGGVVAIGAGVTMWLLDRRDSSAVEPTLAPGDGGGLTFGIAGSF